MSVDYFAKSEIKNLVATVLGKSKNLELTQLPGDPDVQEVLRLNFKKFPGELAKHINAILEAPVNNLENGKVFFEGLLYAADINASVSEDAPSLASLATQKNKVGKGFSEPAFKNATKDFLHTTLSSSAESIIYNPSNAAQIITDPNRLAGTIAGPTANFLQQEVLEKVGVSKKNMPSGTLTTALLDLGKGDFVGLGATLATGALGFGGTVLAKELLNQFSKATGIPIGPRKNPFKGTEDKFFTDRTPPKAATVIEPKHNVGHGLKVEVTLGGLKFDLPPSTMATHGGVHGHVVPGVEAGIRFEHIQNFASLLIPGSTPVYQSLGIQGLVVEFVGAFIGYDHNRLLNNHLNVTVDQDKNYQKLNQWPDPLGIQSLENREGGSWEISRTFVDQVRQGVPMEFLIFNSVSDLATEIRYNVIVLNFTRWYRDKGRTFYRFKCLAVDSAETGRGSTVTAQTAPTAFKKQVQQRQGSGSKTEKVTASSIPDYTDFLTRLQKLKAKVAQMKNLKNSNILEDRANIVQLNDLIKSAKGKKDYIEFQLNRKDLITKQNKDTIETAEKYYNEFLTESKSLSGETPKSNLQTALANFNIDTYYQTLLSFWNTYGNSTEYEFRAIVKARVIDLNLTTPTKEYDLAEKKVQEAIYPLRNVLIDYEIKTLVNEANNKLAKFKKVKESFIILNSAVSKTNYTEFLKGKKHWTSN